MSKFVLCLSQVHLQEYTDTHTHAYTHSCILMNIHKPTHNKIYYIHKHIYIYINICKQCAKSRESHSELT